MSQSRTTSWTLKISLRQTAQQRENVYSPIDSDQFRSDKRFAPNHEECLPGAPLQVGPQQQREEPGG